MMKKPEACCFTGHRPHKLPWGDNESDSRCIALKRRIQDAVESAYEQGWRHFICGMAEGCDFYFCESILHLKLSRPDVVLEAAVPFPGQADRWPRYQQSRYRLMLERCSLHTVISHRYTPGCMHRRDRYMVDHSSLLIAAFDGTPGGTSYTVEYAMKKGVPIVDLAVTG